MTVVCQIHCVSSLRWCGLVCDCGISWSKSVALKRINRGQNLLNTVNSAMLTKKSVCVAGAGGVGLFICIVAPSYN